MIELRDWIRGMELVDRPWLLLGKGPTLAKVCSIDTSKYNTMCLNHVVIHQKVDVAHIVDADVVDHCGHALLRNCRYLVMPRYPHVNNDPTSTRLEDFVEESPILKQLDQEGRLVWYNLSSARAVEDSPVITARFFSAEAALRIIGETGAKEVRSLGVDGGRGYSPQLAGLERRTMLANGRQSFDDQNGEIKEIVAHYGLNYQSLYEPMRVFVGTDESQMVATRVLEYSIRKFATEPVTIHPMLNLPVPTPKDKKNRPRTGFSFARFLIPGLCGYRGRGMYVDADMQVFSDLAELWDIPFDHQKILCTNQPDRPDQWKNSGHFHPGRQMSVMLLNCTSLDWKIDKIIGDMDNGEYDYKQLMFDMCVVEPNEIADRIPPEWNCLEWYETGRSQLTHYTVVPTQPWKNNDNPLRSVWERDYQEAVAAGAVSIQEVLDGISAGHLKESLLNAFRYDELETYDNGKTQPVAKTVVGTPSRAPNALADRVAGAMGKTIRVHVPQMSSHLPARLKRAARRSIQNPAGAVRRMLTGQWD